MPEIHKGPRQFCAAACHASRVATLVALLFAPNGEIDAQFHAKREARIAESGAVQNVKGGSTFVAGVPFDQAYERALNYLKREGYTLDSASADTGQIVTAMDIKGGYTQTGTRILVTCVKDTDTQTSVRVLVTEQKRKKLLQTEPWGDAKANETASSKLADAMKAAVAPDANRN